VTEATAADHRVQLDRIFFLVSCAPGVATAMMAPGSNPNFTGNPTCLSEWTVKRDRSCSGQCCPMRQLIVRCHWFAYA